MAFLKKRVGYYCWAGPGTVRMINLKYFNPKLDEQSLARSYDLPYLQVVKDTFGVTDAWISYSWGFAETQEVKDRQFTLSKLNNFKKLGIRTHGYIQGPNLVYADFADQDWWARDLKGKLISYHRGRKIVCLNNPHFQKYILNKVTDMSHHPFDGIFMDNIQMGQLGIPGTLSTTAAFFGCNCQVCQDFFVKEYGIKIKEAFKSLPGRLQYQKFRTNSTSQFLKKVAALVKQSGKEFGTNSFDPKFDMNHVYGTDLPEVQKIQDYILFENHSLPSSQKQNNSYIHTLIEERAIKKPVFVVSYNQGIGFDSAFSQEQVNRLFSESAHSLFQVCLKGSEFVTKGVWHNLRPENYQPPIIESWSHAQTNLPGFISKIKFRIKVQLIYRLLPFGFISWLFNFYMEHKSVRTTLGWIQVWLLR